MSDKEVIIDGLRAENQRLCHELSFLSQCLDLCRHYHRYVHKLLALKTALKDQNHLTADDCLHLDAFGARLDAIVNDSYRQHTTGSAAGDGGHQVTIACEATLRTDDCDDIRDYHQQQQQQHHQQLVPHPHHHHHNKAHHYSHHHQSTDAKTAHKSLPQQHMIDQQMSVTADGGGGAKSSAPIELTGHVVSKTYIIPVKAMPVDEEEEDDDDCSDEDMRQALAFDPKDPGKGFPHSLAMAVVSGSGGSATGGPPVPVLPNDIKCVAPDCEHSAPNKSSLIRHLSRVHQIQPYECQYVSCGQLCATKQDLDLHVHRKHLKIYRCHWHACGKHFKSLWNLNIHLMTHSADKRFKCNVEDCDYQCIQKRHLIAHMYKHYGLKPFRCTHAQCDKAFSTVGSLRQHVTEVHVAANQFVCDFPDCHKVLKTNRYLLQHKKSHLSAARAAAAGAAAVAAAAGGGGGATSSSSSASSSSTVAGGNRGHATGGGAGGGHAVGGHGFKYATE